MERNYKPGFDLIKSGKCPQGQRCPMACFLCQYGHITECHYPLNCDDAQCSHFEDNTQMQNYIKNCDK